MPDQAAPPIPNSAEQGAGPGESSQGEGSFPGRARRRRLRSPYGFNVRQPAENEPDMQPAAPFDDETPAGE